LVKVIFWGRAETVVADDLLGAVAVLVSAAGFQFVTTLWTRASNARARRLYQGQGYERQAMRPPFKTVTRSSSWSVKS
jgi:hypothetical protein